MNIVNGTKHQLTRGSLFLLTPADFHEIYSFTDEPMDIYNLVFSGEFLGEEIRELMFQQFAEYMVDIDEKNLEAQHRSIQRALVYIHHHFRDPLRLEEAAKQAALAPNYFSQAFRKMTGIHSR